MLKDFIQAVKEEWIDVHSVMVMHEGEIVAAHFWDEWDADTRHVLHSVSKSIAVLGIGMAVDQGKLGLEERLVDIFPDKLPKTVDERLEALNIRHLLTMSAGHDKPLMLSHQRGNIFLSDWTRYYLSIPLDRMPGERFLYDSGCTYLLSAAFQRRMGVNLREYLSEQLFAPMGIWEVPWQACPMGITMGCAGLYLSPAELLKMGQLCLQNGVWEGSQLVPEWWIRECTKVQMDTSEYIQRRFPEYRCGYGYQFWNCTNGAYRMDGSMGQIVVVMPEQEMVIEMTAGAIEARNEPHAMMNLAWEFLGDIR